MLAETRARSAALINQSRELHLQSKGKRRESAELKIACTEAGLACRAAIQRSNLLLREARTETRCDPAELACMIANALLSFAAAPAIRRLVHSPAASGEINRFNGPYIGTRAPIRPIANNIASRTLAICSRGRRSNIMPPISSFIVGARSSSRFFYKSTRI